AHTYPYSLSLHDALPIYDSVVVVENIARHLRAGRTRYEAALQATKQIFVAILGCTACLALAFLPLLALPGTAGKFIRVLPATVRSEEHTSELQSRENLVC